MTQVMVLCAGLGTRLGVLSHERPKALVPVGDAPVLQHIVGQLRNAGFAEALINTHHLAEQLETFAQALPADFTLRLSRERELLGTAGGVQHARARLTWPLLCWNGDLYLEPPLRGLFAAVGNAAACLLVGPTQGPGTVGLDHNGRVVRLRGECFGVEVRAVDYLGVMVLSEALGAALPVVGCLIGDLCLPLLRRGGQLSTLEHAGPWFDTGSLAGYWRANAHWLDTRPLAADGSPEQGGNFVAADVRLPAELSVERSLIGQGATLVGRGAIERCVVWPGATVRAPVRDAIVLESGRIVPLGAEAFVAEPSAVQSEAP